MSSRSPVSRDFLTPGRAVGTVRLTLRLSDPPHVGRSRRPPSLCSTVPCPHRALHPPHGRWVGAHWGGRADWTAWEHGQD